MGRLIEGLWDCKYCEHKGIGGSIRECPHCGKPRDVDTKFYMPGEIKYVDEETASKINREPDWVCPYCDNLNSASYTVCQSCGASRSTENLNYFENRAEKDRKEKQSKSSDYTSSSWNGASNDTPNETVDDDTDESTYDQTPYMDSVGSHSSGYTSSYDDSAEPTKSFAKKLKDGFCRFTGACAEIIEDYGKQILAVLAILAVIIGLIWIFIPKTQEITIDSIYWERSIAVERYQTVDESGWSLPDGARLHETRREIYTYEQVLDHYENKTRQVAKQRISHYEERVVGHRDLGNGYFEEITERVPVYETYYETEHYQEPVYRSEPVYRTKYYYEIDKWLFDRSLTTSGFDKSPYWADTSGLKSDERESTKTEKYYIRGTNSKGKSKEIAMPYNEWTDLNVGDTIKVKVSVFGNGELA